ncbi:hypothetical protein [Rhizobium sp. BK176]|uniref:hypothetical protein n=1 Tax=Rhizobium sp. BK176 TaxID=2587071 RepID=UPI002168B3B8|nr:hypothetical protein [Rhizobium sp. BK176]MCS4089569.1 hypothetical protein [Rhizobium sp. BK176]
MSAYTNDDLKRKAMSTLDIGLAAVFLWTCYSAWIAYAGPPIVSKSILQREAGWSRDTLTLTEEIMIGKFLFYTLAFHTAIWAAYWVARRLRKSAPNVSDVVSIILGGMLTICYLPAFMAGLVLDSTMVDFLWPHTLATLCSHLAYLDAADRPFVYGSAALKVTAILIPVLMYANACITRVAAEPGPRTET